MRLQRLRSNAFYFHLTEAQKLAYNTGLPVEFMGTDIRDLTFVPYAYGSELHKKRVLAASQMNTLIDFANGLSFRQSISATIAFHSAPTDEAAFMAAAAVYTAAQTHKLACRCVSTSTLMSSYKDIEPADVYLIHGINDAPNPAATWALRDFLRDRDGSLRMVVMTSRRELTLDALIHEQLRMHFNYLYCLDDCANEVERERTGRGRSRNA